MTKAKTKDFASEIAEKKKEKRLCNKCGAEMRYYSLSDRWRCLVCEKQNAQKRKKEKEQEVKEQAKQEINIKGLIQTQGSTAAERKAWGKKNKDLVEARNLQILEARNSGMKGKEIAEKFNLAVPRVFQILKKVAQNK